MSFYFFTSFLWGSFFVLASIFFSFSFRSNQFLISSFYFFFLSILLCFWFLVFFFLQFLFFVIFLLFFVISVISTNQRKIINSVCIFRLDLCKPYIFLIKNFEFHFLKCYLVVFSTSTQVMSNSVTRQHCSLPIHQNF